MTDQQTIAKFEEGVAHYMQTLKCSREQAVNAVKRRHPDLAKAYIVATQKNAGARREAAEMLDSLGV